MVVPVWSRVLVPEANHVSQLVDYDAELVTVLAYGYSLSPLTTFANERTTSETNAMQCSSYVSLFGSFNVQSLFPFLLLILE